MLCGTLVVFFSAIFGGTFQCGILAVFWRYFSVFKITDTVPIPRYLGKKYRIPTPHSFFPYRWTLVLLECDGSQLSTL